MTTTFFKLIVNSIISSLLCNVAGFPTSSASGPSGSGGPTRHSSLFNLYCGEDDESESDHVNGFGVGLGGPAGVGPTGGHHQQQPPPPIHATETTFNAAAMPPSVGTLGNTSSTDDDDTSSPGKLKMKLTKKMKNQSAPCVAGC